MTPAQHPKDRLRDPVVRIDQTSLDVDPGGQVRTSISVYNASAIVDELHFEVLGPTSTFARVEPDRLSLMPGNEGTAEVVFSPPIGREIPAGRLPFGVRCVSSVDDYYAAVAEGDLHLGAVHEVEPKLVTVSGRGRWIGQYHLQFTNHGTAPATLDLEAEGGTEELGFALAPQRISLNPGDVDEAFLKVRPVRPYLLGKTVSHQFSIAYQRDTADAREDPTARGVLSGTFEQRPVGSARFLAALAALMVLGGVAAVLLWPEKQERELAVAPPDPPTNISVEATDATDVLIVGWDRSTLAADYRVEQLVDDQTDDVVDTREVGGEQNTLEWDGLEPDSSACFRVIALNDQGESDPTESGCATTTAEPVVVASEPPPPPEATVAAEAPPAEPEATAAQPPAEGSGDGAGADGQASETGGEVGGDQSEGADAGQSEGEEEPTDSAADPSVVSGFYVLYRAIRIEDIAIRDSVDPVLAALQQEGFPARLLVSDDVEGWPGADNTWLILSDDYDTFEEALAHCRIEQLETLAPSCTARVPLSAAQDAAPASAPQPDPVDPVTPVQPVPVQPVQPAPLNPE